MKTVDTLILDAFERAWYMIVGVRVGVALKTNLRCVRSSGNKLALRKKLRNLHKNLNFLAFVVFEISTFIRTKHCIVALIVFKTSAFIRTDGQTDMARSSAGQTDMARSTQLDRRTWLDRLV